MQPVAAGEWFAAFERTLAGLPDWQALVLIVVVSLGVARLIQVGGDVLIRRVTRRIDGEVDDIVLRGVHPAGYVTVVLVGAYLAREPIGLSGALDVGVTATILSTITLVWMVTLLRVGRKASRALVESAEGIDGSIVPIFQNVWTLLVLGVGGFLLLYYWEINVTPLLASAGVLGIIVGLAARDTIANFFGSIALYFDGTYKVGDYIVLETGERGRVEDISIRSTVVRTRDDVLVTIPNSRLNSATIVNESVPERERRIRIPVGVAYGSDLDHVEETLLSVAAAESLVLEQPTPRVRVRGFGDSSVDVELLCWIRDPVLRGRASHLLNKGVYSAFEESGIAIPFPQRDLHVVDGGLGARGDGAAVRAVDEVGTGADDD
ncbi:mechanosensitive ion channel family protein [Salinirubellus sp. GCM10025818]|uniref:mechanosensitive ion channel family protein n=1 Tax=Salinirubellus TaxID=2162630 RepID=UPI0030D5A0B8